MIVSLIVSMVVFNAFGQSLLKYVATGAARSHTHRLLLLAIAYSCSAVVVMLSIYLLKFIAVASMALILAIHFIVAALIGVFLFKETLSGVNKIGLLLIVIGVACASL